jgi:hypothetical protein
VRASTLGTPSSGAGSPLAGVAVVLCDAEAARFRCPVPREKPSVAPLGHATVVVDHFHAIRLAYLATAGKLS